MTKTLSVVIPTHNRCVILQKTLEALFCQNGEDFEIVVVDDGSADDTAQVVSALAAGSPVGLHYTYQENKGAGAARNRGLKQARGKIVLFIDDDIIAAPSLLAEHLRYHRLHPARNRAVLGQVLLAPEIPATPLNLGHAVGMWRPIQDGQEVSCLHFFTGNISLKRSFLLENRILFDETLPRHQDTEIGYRCSKKGLRILYNARAIGYHYHDLTFQAFLRMSRRYGETLAVLHHKYPELKTELGDYLSFSWRNPPRRVIRDLLRPAFLNQLTVAGLLFLGGLADEHYERLPVFVARRIGNYYERKGYQQRVRELKRNQA
jgi:glycosyltransferase involved in cell wall biosynthesis